MPASQAGEEAVGGWSSHLLFLHLGSVPRAVSQGPRPHLSQIGVLSAQWEPVGWKRCDFSVTGFSGPVRVASMSQAFSPGFPVCTGLPFPGRAFHLRLSSIPLHFPFPVY